MLIDPSLIHVDDRSVFSQREALPVIRHQDAFEIRVACELNAEHVEDLALEPVGRFEEIGKGKDWICFGESGFDPQVAVVIEGIEYGDQLKPLWFGWMVNGSEVGEVVKLLVITQPGDHGMKHVGGGFRKGLATVRLPFQDGRTVCGVEGGVEATGKIVFPSFRGHNRGRFGFLRHAETFRFA